MLRALIFSSKTANRRLRCRQRRASFQPTAIFSMAFRSLRCQSRPAWDAHDKSCTRARREQACQFQGLDHSAHRALSCSVKIMRAVCHNIFNDRHKSRKHALIWESHNVSREPAASSELCGSNHRISVLVATGRGIKPPEPTTRGIVPSAPVPRAKSI